MGTEKLLILAKNTMCKPSAIKTTFNARQLSHIDLHGLRPIKSLLKTDTFEKVSTETLKPFKNKQEILNYFDSIGVKLDLRTLSQNDLRTFAHIRNDIMQMEQMGVTTFKPKRIVLSDWRNTDETIQMFDEVNVNCRNMLDYIKTRRAYSHVDSGTVFINSSAEAQMIDKGKSFRKFRHEMGHQNHYVSGTRTDGLNSVLGQSNQNLTFLEKQMKVLGQNEEQLYSTINGIKPELLNISNPMGSNIFVIRKGKPIPLKVDTSKMTAAMNLECKCYNSNVLSEQVAEIFEDLLKGRTFSDRTMLMYDFCGGPRIPNLKIKGHTYDDYIKSLYKNKNLLEELKSFITIT